MSQCGKKDIVKMYVVQPSDNTQIGVNVFDDGVFVLSGVTIFDFINTTVDVINSNSVRLTPNDIYFTGFTYDQINTFTLFRNDGFSIPVTINDISVNTIYSNIFSGGTFFGDGSNLTGVVSSDTFVTGFTYNNQFNQINLSQNNNTEYNIYLDEMSGMTFNGDIRFNDGNIVDPNFIQFNVEYTGNTIIEGRMYWGEEYDAVVLGMHNNNVLQKIGQDQFYLIKNQTGGVLNKGTVIRASGTLGASGRILGDYMIADGSIEENYTLGIAAENIPNGDDGLVYEFGEIRNINTTGSLYGETWLDGDVLYVSPTINGGLTKFVPNGNNKKIEIALVIHASANGSLFIRPNRFPHLYDLQEVNYSAGTENNLDILQRIGSVWELTNTPSFISVSATTFFGDGSNLTGVSATDNFTTGATLIGNTIVFDRTDQLSAYTVDLSSIIISGSSGTSGTSGIDGTSGSSGVDGTSGTSGSSGIDGTSGTSGSSGISGEDNFVSGGTYNPITKDIEFVGTSSATTFNVDLSLIVTSTGTTRGYSSFILTGGTFYEFSGETNTLIINKTVSSKTTVNLPLSPDKDTIYVVTDRKGDSWRYPITVNGNTWDINGYPFIVIKIKNNPSLTFLFNGFEYVII